MSLLQSQIQNQTETSVPQIITAPRSTGLPRFAHLLQIAWSSVLDLRIRHLILFLILHTFKTPHIFPRPALSSFPDRTPASSVFALVIVFIVRTVRVASWATLHFTPPPASAVLPGARLTLSRVRQADRSGVFKWPCLRMKNRYALEIEIRRSRAKQFGLVIKESTETDSGTR